MLLSSILRIELDEVGLGFLFMLTKVGKHQQTWYECWLGERLSVIISCSINFHNFTDVFALRVEGAHCVYLAGCSVQGRH